MSALAQNVRNVRRAGPITGLALTHAWILTPFLSSDIFYMWFHLGFAVALIGCAALYRVRPGGTILRKPALLIAAGLMTVSSIVFFSTGACYVWVDVACGVIGGAGSAYVFARWFELYCTFSLKPAVSYTLLAFSLSGCVRLILVLIYSVSPLAVVGVLAVLPVCAALLLIWDSHPKPLDDRGPQRFAFDRPVWVGMRQDNAWHARVQKNTLALKTSEAGSLKLGAVIAILVEFAVYGVVFGLLRNGINEWSVQTPSMLMGHLLRIVMPLLLLWWFVAHGKGEQNTGVLRIVLLVVMFCLLAALFFGGLAEIVLSAIVLAARSLVSLLIYVRLFDLVYRSGVHPHHAFGVGRAVYEFGLVGGILLFSALSATHMLGQVPLEVVYFVVSCVLLVMLNSFSTVTKLPILQFEAKDGGEVPAPQAFASIDEACDQLAQQFNLSSRELEIMKLTVRGHTKRRIADTLSLSEDTIRYHAKQLYRKLDIHSRQELLDMLGVD